MTNTVQIEYGAIAQASKIFTHEQHNTQELLATVKRQLGALQGGGWKGRAAEAFFQEMEQDILPAMQRLLSALSEGAETCRQIAEVFEQAEQEAADLFSQRTTLEGFNNIKPHTGGIPILPGIYLKMRDNFLDPSDYKLTANDIREWVSDASKYHDVPPELVAVILQQENNPEASTLRKIGQYIERQGTTVLAALDKITGDIIPDKLAGGSTGIGNVTRPTLQGTIDYTEKTYHKPIMPDSENNTALSFIKHDTGISGLDMKADVYYVAAHLRQLIDREVGGGRPYQGSLNREQIQRVLAAYNGSGTDALKYGQDAVERLDKANRGEKPLYFFGGH